MLLHCNTGLGQFVEQHGQEFGFFGPGDAIGQHDSLGGLDERHDVFMVAMRQMGHGVIELRQGGTEGGDVIAQGRLVFVVPRNAVAGGNGKAMIDDDLAFFRLDVQVGARDQEQRNEVVADGIAQFVQLVGEWMILMGVFHGFAIFPDERAQTVYKQMQ